MFNCDVCSALPRFFRADNNATSRDHLTARSDRRLSHEEDDGGVIREEDFVAIENRHKAFRLRSPEQLLLKTKAWENFLHPRAMKFWVQPELIRDILTKVAQHIDREEDPVIGDSAECVIWHGATEKQLPGAEGEEDVPVIRAIKPGESQESALRVRNLLVFLFADDESFQQIEGADLEMACGQPDCINISHIAL